VSILRMARLMRLSRLFRMARLLRYVPELLIMVKAIGAATRSVGFTLALLVIALYVFGIAFTQTLKQTQVGADKFNGVAMSMHNLFVHGTLMDDISGVMADLEKESLTGLMLLYVFVIVSAVTIMNMLIGVLCEVIQAVAAAEKETLTVSFVLDELNEVFKSTSDSNNDGKLQKNEFFDMMQNKTALTALADVGVDPIAVVGLADIIFEGAEMDADDPDPDNAWITMHHFMDSILNLRGSNTATVKDIVDLRKWSTAQFRAVDKLIGKVQTLIESLQRPETKKLSRRHSTLEAIDTRFTLRAASKESAHLSVGSSQEAVPMDPPSAVRELSPLRMAPDKGARGSRFAW